MGKDIVCADVDIKTKILNHKKFFVVTVFAVDNAPFPCFVNLLILLYTTDFSWYAQKL